MTVCLLLWQISGITEPWLYIGPGFAGMHQEDGMMNSINVSVPVSVLPMTDELLMDNGIDFLTATKVGDAARVVGRRSCLYVTQGHLTT